jgi:predicted dinucleotide-binding enzyme
MDVAVIGMGNVGGAIGRAVARAGHRVWFGSRHPDGDQGAADPATVVTIGEAIAAADVVILTIPGTAVAALLTEHGAALAGKLVVDAANRIGGPGPSHNVQTVAELAPDARYARAFNTLGWENFDRPQFGDVTADLFFCAAAADRATVETLISAVGLNPIYLGPDQHDILDSVTLLWFTLAVGQHRGRHLAFKVLHD